VSACTSTSTGRVPSTTGTITLPTAPLSALGEEDLGRVLYPAQPAAAHFEYPDFARGAEPVFDAPQQTIATESFALEVQDHVYKVF